VAVWALVATVVLATRRTALGRLVPAEVRTPVLVGAGAMSLLLVAQAAVVDHVTDLGAPGLADREVWAWFVNHRAEPFTLVMKWPPCCCGVAGAARRLQRALRPTPTAAGAAVLPQRR
jgi:hypothetical protein